MDLHLNSGQIDELLQSATDSKPNQVASRDHLEEARKHLKDCATCQTRMRAHEHAIESLALLKPTTPGEKGPMCPPDYVWLEVAAGISGRDSENYLNHAAQCDPCGLLLLRASSDMSEHVSAEETEAIVNLRSNESSWQRALVQKMIAPLHTDDAIIPAFRNLWSSLVLRFWPVWSVGLAAICCIAIWLGVQATLTPDANHLLATAYTENRAIELRIAGAQYAALKAERGAVGSSVDQPQSLLEANALISRELKSHPDDPKWLQAKARSDLLESHYESAIETLHRTLDLDPASTEAMIDLATAYYERAVANNDRQVDYGSAIDYLGRALGRTPDNRVALFNRAICLEKLHLYGPAINDWQDYLRLDSKGPWAQEARKRLEQVQSKVAKKQSSLRAPLWSTARLASIGESTALSNELESRVEDYQRTTIEEWLPAMFPQTVDKLTVRKAIDASVASKALAGVLRSRHGDSWMTDLLHDPRRVSFEAGLVELAAGVRANERGGYEEGFSSAQRAARSFESAGSLAGLLRSQAEQVYSYHLLYDGRQCMALLRKMNPALRRSRYEWLKAQMSLEEGNCAMLLGDFGLADIAFNRGTSLAADHHYDALFLRGVGFQAQSAASLGDVRRGFSLAAMGLSSFWSSDVDLMKGYNLYTDLDTAADVLRLPNLQVALWQQATALVDLHPDVLLRAMAHRWLGNSAYLANMPNLAAVEFLNASRLFSEAPPTEATARGEMDADIWLASLETRSGDLEHAAARLQQVKEILERSPSFGPEMGFYSTQAELALRQKDLAGTEIALRSAIFLAEWALKSFPSQDNRAQWATQTDHAYRDLVTWKLEQGKEVDALELWDGTAVQSIGS